MNECFQDIRYAVTRKTHILRKIASIKVYSQFNMKLGFWQIGIKDQEKHKTIFAVPHGHYEWNDMPFGLKNALSEFQHKMDEVQKPISEFCLVYINDALIFSDNEKARAEYLMKFKDLTYKHDLALSESKMKIRLEEIDFLGLYIKEGHIIPQPHIAEKIFQFPEKLLGRKQI